MVTFKSSPCKSCLLDFIPMGLVTGTNLSGGLVNGISTSPLIAGNTQFNSGNGQLQWSDGNAFSNFSNWDNVSVKIFNDCNGFIIEMCPQNARLPMHIDNQIFAPCVPFFDISAIDANGSITTIQDIDFVEPVCGNCFGCGDC